MTKRLAAAFLALFLSALAAGCTRVPPPISAPQSSASDPTTTPTSTMAASPTPDVTPVPDATFTPAVSPVPEPVLPTSDDPKEISSSGTMTGSQYINEALEISFTLPNGWRFATNEEIAQAMQLGADMLMDDPEAFIKTLKEQPYFIDVMASEGAGTNNFNIGYTDLVQSGLSALLSENVFAAAVESQYKAIEAFQNSIFTQGSHSLGGKEYVTLSIDSMATSLGLYQRQYFKKLGSTHLVVITITATCMERADEIAALFQSL